MKKTLIILTLISVLAACGDKDSSTSSASSTSISKPSKKAEKLLACSILSKEHIKSTYKGATIDQINELGRALHPLCAVRFQYEGAEYDLSLTIGVLGDANDSYLESSVSYFKGKGRIESITGAGEKAYLRNGGADQISALSGNNLIHVSAYKANKFDLELTKKFANDMFKILD